MDIKYTQLKHIKNELEDNVDWKEVVDEIISLETDFTVGQYRFIDTDCIDDIMREELSSDLYILGCFNANFLSSIIELDEEIITALQEGEKYKALGRHCLRYIGEIVEGYVSADGYGHHFSHYDGYEHELRFKDGKGDEEMYYYFKVD